MSVEPGAHRLLAEHEDHGQRDRRLAAGDRQRLPRDRRRLSRSVGIDDQEGDDGEILEQAGCP